ncbi:MAG: tetraacyldisaccharide 4'-kinase [marine benthic group bacterium]|nr:tetraacyldisaccharide 4'-kinase [Gemmatimonadota bacterium]MCL7973640.1 tetraacyldisaccharide 4'-kinase [Gemmatimonadota bacterium]MCL7979499.1 tetraacyldisaccharide 4'-kinase [Gemmatimonadota bacterium]MCL7989847.1 tetraacyldisaccharide 4'-kinase [Gemmatimonadota bacterium]
MTALSRTLRAELERRVRDAWSVRPGVGLNLASMVYGLAHDVRDLLYEAGILHGRRVPVPVISVGGLTSGGSGKTPVSASIAGWLFEGGGRPAMITGGIPDEAEVQRLLNPDVLVEDDRDRRAAIQRAMASGARSVVLDSGFQHRRIRSDLQIVCIDPLSASMTARRRLPAGPFRERWSSLQRADAIVLVHRGNSEDPSLRTMETEVRRVAPGPLIVQCLLHSSRFSPANQLAEGTEPSTECAAVAGIMWPEPFFDAVDRLGLSPSTRLAFRDHEPYAAAELSRIRAAGPGGVVCTLKDAVKLGPLLAGECPVWYLEERPVWGVGKRRLRDGVLRTGGGDRSLVPAPNPGEQG